MASKFLEAILGKAKEIMYTRGREIVEQVQAVQQEDVKRIGEKETVVKVTLLGLFQDMLKQEVKEEIEEFYLDPEYPFVDVYDTEYFKTHKKNEWYALVEFDILVAADRNLSRRLIHDRCHKIVESEPGVVAFNVKLI